MGVETEFCLFDSSFVPVLCPLRFFRYQRVFAGRARVNTEHGSSQPHYLRPSNGSDTTHQFTERECVFMSNTIIYVRVATPRGRTYYIHASHFDLLECVRREVAQLEGVPDLADVDLFAMVAPGAGVAQGATLVPKPIKLDASFAELGVQHAQILFARIRRQGMFEEFPTQVLQGAPLPV